MSKGFQYKRRALLTVFWMVAGAALSVLGIMGVIDSYWCGMGGGLIGVGVVNTIRIYRYHKDESYREEVDIQNADERNRFIAGKAWAWAGYLYVLINGVAVVVLKLMGYDDLSTWAAYNVCGILLLYWLCWLWLRRKY